MDAADRDAVRRPLDHHDHEDTVIGYVIRGEFLDPGDVKPIFARGDGAEAERLFRHAVAEAERRFDLALAARNKPETTPLLELRLAPRRRRTELRRGGRRRARTSGDPPAKPSRAVDALHLPHTPRHD